jgi:hypothetical protein
METPRLTRRTSVSGRNYVLHIRNGVRTWCGRYCVDVNCASLNESERDPDSETLCRACRKARRARASA